MKVKTVTANLSSLMKKAPPPKTQVKPKQPAPKPKVKGKK